jgi:antitoxin (DNA-binding transcriptional repressor) of toxin-antitoxin stability system
MSTVGLREFKNKFSKYVNRARSGESLSITDRGHVVAELGPPKRISQDGEPITTLDELRRRGVLYGGGARNDASLYPAMPRVLKRPTANLLDEERGGH